MFAILANIKPISIAENGIMSQANERRFYRMTTITTRTLRQMEDEALDHLNHYRHNEEMAQKFRMQANIAWMQLTEVLIEIQQSKLWKERGFKSFDAYLQDFVGFTAGNFGHKRRALPIAQAIFEASGKAIAPTERELRPLVSKIPDDATPDVIVRTYTAYKQACELSDTHTPNALASSAVDVASESVTTGSVEVENGEQVPVDTPGALGKAVVLLAKEKHVRSAVKDAIFARIEGGKVVVDNEEDLHDLEGKTVVIREVREKEAA